jgi:hypothetical protein
MSKHCPICQKVLYNRRLVQCGFCGAPIPESLRFTTEEIAALDRKMAGLEEQRQQRERAAQEARQSAEGDGGIGFM